MFSVASIISGAVGLVRAFLDLFRSEKLRQDGRNEAAARSGRAAARARKKGDEIRTPDDATNVARRHNRMHKDD